MQVIHCSQCGGQMTILPQMAGSAVACPHCGGVVSVPTDLANPTPLPMASPARMGPPPGMPPQMMQYGYVPQQKTSGLAIASLVFGILSFCAGICGVVAIILGICARMAIADNSTLGGKNMATWGLVLGIFGLVLNVVCTILFWDEYQKMFGL